MFLTSQYDPVCFYAKIDCQMFIHHLNRIAQTSTELFYMSYLIHVKRCRAAGVFRELRK